MGDRANVYVHEGDEPGVYLYTHWAGVSLPQRVRNALTAGTSRWGDVAYLTRIIFDEMTEEHHGGLTGFGISATVQDGDDRIVDVDTATQAVKIGGRSWSFRHYIQDQSLAVWV